MALLRQDWTWRRLREEHKVRTPEDGWIVGEGDGKMRRSGFFSDVAARKAMSKLR